jgi:6-phosphogluconolactonase (cycloisomerase 2 family)
LESAAIVDRKLGVTGVSVLFAIAMLAACGGGGDTGGDTTAAAPPPDNVAGFAYVVNNGSDNVSAYAIDTETGALTEVAGSPFAAGVGPTAIAVDPSGRFAYVTNGGSFDFTDTISAFTIDATTGALTSAGPAQASRSGPRSVAVDPSGKFVYTANGGSSRTTTSNDVSAYTLNAMTGALSAVAGSPFAAGSNPSSVTVDPTGRFAYVSNQASRDVRAYAIDTATGALASIGVGGITAGVAHEVTVDPSGRFVYAANGESDSVSAYAIDTATGALSHVTGSPFPAVGVPLSVTVHPSGKFAYVTSFAANSVSVYTIDAATGALASSGAAAATGTQPGSVTVDRSGRFAYVTNGASSNVSAYAINATTGALTAVGAAVAAGTRPTSITTTRRIQ